MVTGVTTPAGTWFHKACKDVVPASSLAEGSIDEVFNQRGLKRNTGHTGLFAVFTGLDNLWGGTPQKLKYYFIDGTETQRRKVRDAIDEWTWYANVVFEEISSFEDSDTRIKFDPDDGSWSYIGRQCKKINESDATMNLAWIDKQNDITLNERASILHEFGHTLGLLHEHQSPAHGDQAVKNIQATIDLYERTQGWDIQQIYDQVINVYALADVSNFSQVDTSSIMHYPQPKEITGLAEDIPYNQKLSDLDKAYMILQYPRKQMHPIAEQDGWSFEKALATMQVPDDLAQQILQIFRTDRDAAGEISPVNSRLEIQEWTRSAHAGALPAPGGVHPAHGVQLAQNSPVAGAKPTGQLIDALKSALGDGNVAEWLKHQPEGTKAELWEKLAAAFGKASGSG